MFGLLYSFRLGLTFFLIAEAELDPVYFPKRMCINPLEARVLADFTSEEKIEMWKNELPEVNHHKVSTSQAHFPIIITAVQVGKGAESVPSGFGFQNRFRKPLPLACNLLSKKNNKILNTAFSDSLIFFSEIFFYRIWITNWLTIITPSNLFVHVWS